MNYTKPVRRIKVVRQLSEDNAIDELEYSTKFHSYVDKLSVVVNHENASTHAMFSITNEWLPEPIVVMTKEEYHEFVKKLLEFDELNDI